jgi:polygalacturonase
MIVRLIRALRVTARAALLATGCLGFVLASLALTSAGSASASAAKASAAKASAATVPAAGQARPVFSVMNYGAAGNGTANDTPAIDAAITAANAAGPGGGIVEFPAGTYLAGGSIHLMSNVTMQLDAGSVITAAATGFDPPEPNAYSQYQDYGHSHFHDSVIWGRTSPTWPSPGPGRSPAPAI